MAVIGKKKRRGTPEVSTSSLPDIIFTLLFFFMVSAKVKDSTLKIDYNAPKAIETKKLTSKDQVSTLYMGVPLRQYRGLYGSEPVLQMKGQIKDLPDIYEWVTTEISEVDYDKKQYFLVNIKADNNVPTKLFTDTKLELRKAGVTKLNLDSKPLDY